VSFPLYLDENVDTLLARILTNLGHDVLTARDADLSGASDEQHLELAASVGRAVLTHDIGDYSNLWHAWQAAGRSHSGILVLRRRSVYEMRDRLVKFFDAFPDGIQDLYLYLSSLE
jgi:hypothetical protein